MKKRDKIQIVLRSEEAKYKTELLDRHASSARLTFGEEEGKRKEMREEGIGKILSLSRHVVHRPAHESKRIKPHRDP